MTARPYRLFPERRSVLVPADPRVPRVLPEAREVATGGARGFVVPHDLAATAALRALGYAVPSPALHYYSFGNRSPFDVQRKTIDLLTLNRRAFVLNGLGTGKTLASLWAFDYLRQEGQARRALVVAPLSTLRFVWEREAALHLPHLSVAVLHGTKAQRLDALASGADICVINHDGLKVLAKELRTEFPFEVVIIDELTAFRNAASRRTKVARVLFKDAKYLWGLTGSPTPNSPVDAHGQILLLRPDLVPLSQARFRDRVMYQVSQFKWLPRNDAQETLAKLFVPSVRFTIDDVMELPDVHYRTVEIEATPKQKKAYDDLRKWMLTYIDRGEEGEKVIKVMNEGVLWLKLLQCSLGYIYAAQGMPNVMEPSVAEIDPHVRQEVLVSLINDSESKVIVWVPFIHAMAGVCDALRAAGISYRVVAGSTPPADRASAFGDFQNVPVAEGGPKVLVAHPRCAAHGLTLTAASVCVWFGPVLDYELFEQANARIRRVGQRARQQIVLLVSTKAEREAYRRLRARQDFQGALLDLLRNQEENVPVDPVAYAV